jgi:hypothetical protein
MEKSHGANTSSDPPTIESETPANPQPPQPQHGARCRVRTCDPIRVKDVLYH